jgi:hypothetical protein
MPHSRYLSNIASSGFYLFPIVKEKLERIQVADEDQFFERLQEIPRSLDQQDLNSFFHVWVPRVQEPSKGNRDSLEIQLSRGHAEHVRTRRSQTARSPVSMIDGAEMLDFLQKYLGFEAEMLDFLQKQGWRKYVA